jgi:hypothetical protein
MSSRMAYVVATHPEDHSVDLVMAKTGERLVGVQVQSHDASSRTGTANLPAVPEKKDKWDITQLTGQDAKAIVSYVDGQPIVTGFIFPQINQVLSKDPKLKVERHQSDVMKTIDGNGNIDMVHPGGFRIRIGETPEHADYTNKNADASATLDRNTDKKSFMRISTSDNALVITISPDGKLDLKCNGTVDVDAQGAVTVKTAATAHVESGGATSVKAPSVTVDSPQSTFTGAVTVQGLLSFMAGMVGQGGEGGAAATLTGNVNVTSGDVNVDGVSAKGHTHGGVSSGGANTAAPNGGG